MNTFNGGLAVSCSGEIYLADTVTFSGTHIFDGFGQKRDKTEFIMRYMQSDGERIYFSDQSAGNVLSVLDCKTRRRTALGTGECRNLLLRGNSLYYIEENGGTIQRYNLRTGASESIMNDFAWSFIDDGESIYYFSPRGIGVLDTESGRCGALLSAGAVSMDMLGRRLIFADSNGVLSVYDIPSGERYMIDTVRTDSIAVIDKLIYAVDIKDRSILRIDIFKGEILHVYGDCARRLHSIGDSLFFIDESGNWRSLSMKDRHCSRYIVTEE